MLLADHYLRINNLEEAERTFLELEDLVKVVMGEENGVYFRILVKLSTIFYEREEYQKAIEMLEKIENHKNQAEEDYALTINNFANCYAKLGDKEQVKQYLLMNIEHFKGYKGERSLKHIYNEIITKFKLGEYLTDRQDFDGAQVFIIQALNLVDEQIAEQNPYIVDDVYSLLALLLKNERTIISRQIYPYWKKIFFSLPQAYPITVKQPALITFVVEDPN